MTHSLDRRRFLSASAAAAVLTQTTAGARGIRDREYYELRRYRVDSSENHGVLLEHLEKALVPALRRAGVTRVGVFVAAEEDTSHDVHVLLVFPTLDVLATLDDTLVADAAFQEEAEPFYAGTDESPAYIRIESRLLQAFASIPTLELPEETKTGAPRLFEIRTYESKNADAARRKVEMFDVGETQLMRDVGLAPVFFGAARIGHDVPNLTYMLSAPDSEAHQAHWKAFLEHPEWERMKVIARYATTVSKISNLFVKPAAFSQI